MWAELLPKMVGGTLTDHDAPDEPTPITGYELTDQWVEVTGRDFSFASAREYIGINATGVPGRMVLRTAFGMSATVDMPQSPAVGRVDGVDDGCEATPAPQIQED